jgi:acyl-CoA synthetase (AMP-forming)/AMP-acid ligase II
VLLYIYTSGTTGLPKASRISHTRYFVASSPFRIMCALTKSDRIYTPLPLYHSSAVMLGVGGAIISGACMVIRRKFSVKAFTEDCLKYNITAVRFMFHCSSFLVSLTYPSVALPDCIL